MEAREKMLQIVRHLDSKKARDIKALGVSDLTILADYFVICSAPSSTQVKSLADTLEEKMDSLGVPITKMEGKQGFNWLLLDYSDVIVHIFYQETREFYGLEKLWQDAEVISLDDILEED